MSQIAFRPLTLNLFLPSKLNFELLFELKNLEEMQLIASDRCKQSQSYNHLRIIPSNSDSYNTSTFKENSCKSAWRIIPGHLLKIILFWYNTEYFKKRLHKVNIYPLRSVGDYPSIPYRWQCVISLFLSRLFKLNRCFNVGFGIIDGDEEMLFRWYFILFNSHSYVYQNELFLELNENSQFRLVLVKFLKGLRR